MRTAAENKAVTMAEHKSSCACSECARGPAQTDPQVGDHPAVVTATKAVRAAQEAYERLNAAWGAVVVKRRSLELSASSGNRWLTTADGTPIPDPETQRRMLEARQLRPAEEEAFTAREQAGDRLREAKQAERDAHARARWQIG